MKDLEKCIYENYYTIHFSTSHTNITSEYKKFFPYFRKNYGPFLPANKKATVVDLACGTGSFLNYLAKSGYINSVGVDNSPECVAICLKNKLNVVHCDVFSWLRNNKCDAIIANDFLEHLTQEQFNLFLDLAHDALNEGGVLITKVPNAANPITGTALRYIDYTHKTSFTELSLKAALKVYFEKTIVLGQKLFVYYWNPLNYLGIMAHLIFDNIFRLLSYLYGQPEIKIFKKSIISVSYKNKPGQL